jgi:hypothetical protein
MLPIKRYEPEQIYLNFEEGGKHPERPSDPDENHGVRFSTPENPLEMFQAPIYKNVEFFIYFLPEERSRMRFF